MSDEIKARTSFTVALDQCGEIGVICLKRLFCLESRQLWQHLRKINLHQLKRQIALLESNNMPIGDALKSQVQVLILSADVYQITEMPSWTHDVGLYIYATDEERALRQKYVNTYERLLDCVMRYIAIITQ